MKTSIEVLTRNGNVYVENIDYLTTQDACDVAMVLLKRGYGVNMSVGGSLNGHTSATWIKKNAGKLENGVDKTVVVR